jgi:hypothetical protein
VASQAPHLDNRYLRLDERGQDVCELVFLRREAVQPFSADTKNVAVERDFYRLEDLQDGDADFVR